MGGKESKMVTYIDIIIAVYKLQGPQLNLPKIEKKEKREKIRLYMADQTSASRGRKSSN